jgi:ABC-2 type transport system ATP-binding protein
MDERPVAARGLVKRYGHVLATDGIDLTVERGDVYGFLGPNGAGKTTTLRILLGLIRPDGGTVRLFGRDPHEDAPKALAGVAGFVEEPRFYPYLSGRTNLELLAAFDRGDARSTIDEALELVELVGRAGDRVGGYSQGMRQRLGIAASLLRSPRLLLLDEPTNGLDPGGMRDMRNLIRCLAVEGITILLSSHLLYEVEDLCNRVAIVRDGRIVYEGTIEDLHGGRATEYRLRTTDHDRARTVLERHPGVASVADNGAELVFSADETTAVAVSRALVEAGVGIAALIPEAASLEALFFELTEDRPEAAAA